MILNKPLYLTLSLLCLSAPLLRAQEGKPLQRAEITTIVNEVRVVKPQAAPQPAKVSEIIRPNEGVLTGPKSRAELVFSDKTLARLGANTQFTFVPGSRTTEIQQGTMLLQVPKGAGGAQVKTAAVTAAVTGTTIMIEFFPGISVKIIVLEGTLRVSLTNRLGESLLLTPGKMLIMKPDATRIPDPVDVDLKKLVKTSKLIAGMGESDELSKELIDEEIANQQRLKNRGTLLDTNMVILGSGTELILSDLELLAAIEQAIDARNLFSDSGSGGGGNNPPPGPPPPPPNTPLNTITNPDPFLLGPDATVSTNPTITNSFGTFQGATYTTTGSGDMAFLFGSTSPTDAALGADDDSPPTTLAAFRFTNLTMTGNPTFNTGSGVTALALIAENNLVFNPATYTFTGLTELLYGAGNSITIPSGVIFNNPALELGFYARNPGSDLTFLGSATVAELSLLAANNIAFGPIAFFFGTGFNADALGSISINAGSTINASSFIDLIANDSILIDSTASLSTSFAFFEAGNLIILPGGTLTATGFADLAANTLNLTGIFNGPVGLYTEGGGVTGGATFLDLRQLTTVFGGSVNAGFIQSSAPLGTLWSVSGELLSATSVLAPNVDIQADGINFGTGSFNARNVTIFGLNSGLGLQGTGGITANDIVALTLPIVTGGTITANSILAGSVTSSLAGINVATNLTAPVLNAASDVTVGGNLNALTSITVTGNSTVSANNMSLGAIQTLNLTDDVTYTAPNAISLTSFGGPGSLTIDAPSLFFNNNFNSSDIFAVTAGASSLNQLTVNGLVSLNAGIDDFSDFNTLVLNGGAIHFSTGTFVPSGFVSSADNLILDILGNGPGNSLIILNNVGTYISFNQASFGGTGVSPDGGALQINTDNATLGNGTERMGNVQVQGFNVASGPGGNGGSFTLSANNIEAPSGIFPFEVLADGGGSLSGDGGAGGLANLVSTGDFEVATTVLISARGGNGSGTSANGGQGGGVSVGAAGLFSTAGFFFQLDATGGAGTNNGGNGGTVNVSGFNGVDLGPNSFLYASSFGGGTGTGGNAGSINVSSVGGPVSIGGFSDLHAIGGNTPGTGQLAGHGGSILISSAGDITVGTSTEIVASGGNNPSGIGGNGGTIVMDAATGIIDLTNNVAVLAGSGIGVIDGAGGTINLNAQEIKVGSVTASNLITDGPVPARDGGLINLTALRATGQAISIENSSQLSALAAAAATNGGRINLTSLGGAINITNSSLQAAGGTSVRSQIQVRNDGPTGAINLTNANLMADILKVGALGPGGEVIISASSSLTASDTLRIYGGTGSGTVRFTGPGVVTLAGGGSAYISATTVQIDSGTSVNNAGLASTTVNAVNHQYNAPGFGNFTDPVTPLFDPNTRPPF